MSDKDRRKKDGHDKNKENQAMHEAVQKRHQNAGAEKESTDERDVRMFKQGSENDRTTQGNQGSTS